MAQEPNDRIDLLPGTLDMLILRSLLATPRHGHGISKYIEQTSQDVLGVPHGSLYPALHRLERKGWVTSNWETTPQGREMKFYRLTEVGRAQLASEENRWAQMVRAIARVMRPA